MSPFRPDVSSAAPLTVPLPISVIPEVAARRLAALNRKTASVKTAKALFQNRFIAQGSFSENQVGILAMIREGDVNGLLTSNEFRSPRCVVNQTATAIPQHKG